MWILLGFHITDGFIVGVWPLRAFRPLPFKVLSSLCVHDPVRGPRTDSSTDGFIVGKRTLTSVALVT